MQVHGQHPVHPGGLHDVGHQPRGDRLARTTLLVLARIAHPGHHGGDPVRRRQPSGLRHDQELHEILVHRPAGRLDDEHVGAADALPVLDVDLAIGEGLDLHVRPSSIPSFSAIFVTELGIASPREHHQRTLGGHPRAASRLPISHTPAPPCSWVSTRKVSPMKAAVCALPSPNSMRLRP